MVEKKVVLGLVVPAFFIDQYSCKCVKRVISEHSHRLSESGSFGDKSKLGFFVCLFVFSYDRGGKNTALSFFSP